MPSAKQQVVGLIHDYQAAVYRAVALLNAKSEQEKGFQLQQERPGVWAGYLDELKQVHYSFHGAGCLITTPTFKVDFDYAQEGAAPASILGSCFISYKATPPYRRIIPYSRVVNKWSRFYRNWCKKAY
jgi:hypothetical protein